MPGYFVFSSELKALLQEKGFFRVIVFARTRSRADEAAAIDPEADDLADAFLARCFGAATRPTTLHAFRPTPRDALLAFLALAVLGVVTVIRFPIGSERRAQVGEPRTVPRKIEVGGSRALLVGPVLHQMAQRSAGAVKEQISAVPLSSRNTAVLPSPG